MNEAVRRFIERHATSPREAVRADAAPYIGMSPAERAIHLDAACRLAAEALLASPFRERVLIQRELPSEGWVVLVRRAKW